MNRADLLYVLEKVRKGGLHTSKTNYAYAEEHALCVQLEHDGLIRRVVEEPEHDHWYWEAV